jgi:hypothetical protein
LTSRAISPQSIAHSQVRAFSCLAMDY